MIEKGIVFYKKAVPVIKNGVTKRIGAPIKSERHPEGIQIVLRGNEELTLIVIHAFENAPARIDFPLDERAELVSVYTHDENSISLADGSLVIENIEDFSGYGILLRRR